MKEFPKGVAVRLSELGIRIRPVVCNTGRSKHRGKWSDRIGTVVGYGRDSDTVHVVWLGCSPHSKNPYISCFLEIAKDL